LILTPSFKSKFNQHLKNQMHTASIQITLTVTVILFVPTIACRLLEEHGRASAKALSCVCCKFVNWLIGEFS